MKDQILPFVIIKIKFLYIIDSQWSIVDKFLLIYDGLKKLNITILKQKLQYYCGNHKSCSLPSRYKEIKFINHDKEKVFEILFVNF
jgi:hypothetical protein